MIWGERAAGLTILDCVGVRAMGGVERRELRSDGFHDNQG